MELISNSCNILEKSIDQIYKDIKAHESEEKTLRSSALQRWLNESINHQTETQFIIAKQRFLAIDRRLIGNKW